ncbi:hypothetical protein ACQ4PT_068402 [Festuca glaucescens]
MNSSGEQSKLHWRRYKEQEKRRGCEGDRASSLLPLSLLPLSPCRCVRLCVGDCPVQIPGRRPLSPLSLLPGAASDFATGSVPNGPRLFYAGPDFVARGMSSPSTSQSPALTEGESTTANDNARPHDPGTDSAGPARSRLSLQLDQRSLHFAVNAWVLIVALIGILPLATRQLQYKGYRLSLLGTTCTTGYALFALYGLPRVGNTQAVQAWGHLVTSSKDFIPFMYCLMFVTSKLHLKLVLVPVICWALEHVARFLRRHFTNSSLYRAYLEPLCTWVDRNTTAVNFLIANAEILLGFLLILALFSKQRNVMQTFMYWQLLKLMYHSPFTAGYHRAIWLKIGRTVNPYIHSYTPFLHDPMNAGMRWWFR